MADVVISELLCFLSNYFGKVAKSVLITNVAGFYEGNEIVEAKTELFNFVSTLDSSLVLVGHCRCRGSMTKNNQTSLQCHVTTLPSALIQQRQAPRQLFRVMTYIPFMIISHLQQRFDDRFTLHRRLSVLSLYIWLRVLRDDLLQLSRLTFLCGNIQSPMTQVKTSKTSQ